MIPIETDSDWSSFGVIRQNIVMDTLNSKIEIGPWLVLVPRDLRYVAINCALETFDRLTQKSCLKATDRDFDVFLHELYADLQKQLQDHTSRQNRRR